MIGTLRSKGKASLPQRNDKFIRSAQDILNIYKLAVHDSNSNEIISFWDKKDTKTKLNDSVLSKIGNEIIRTPVVHKSSAKGIIKGDQKKEKISIISNEKKLNNHINGMNRIFTCETKNKHVGLLNNFSPFREISNNSLDTSVYFLRELSFDASHLQNHLKFLEVLIEIEMIFEIEFPRNERVFTNTTELSSQFKSKLMIQLNKYFVLLNEIYNANNEINDSFFIFSKLNLTYHNTIKLQIIFFTILVIAMTQMSSTDVSLMCKGQLRKMLSELSSGYLNLYNVFMIEEIIITYSYVLSYFKSDFLDKFNQIYSVYKLNKGMKMSDVMYFVNKSNETCLNEMKYYANVSLKYSVLASIGEALSGIISTFERSKIVPLAKTMLNVVLFYYMWSNQRIMSIYENLSNETPPFLPVIKNKSTYTLVLDLDETLIHFIYTHPKGMYLIRPHCMEFLIALSDMYEIVSFTAGTQEYADEILNLLEKCCCCRIFQHRLYRHHLTISNGFMIKDLSKLGRELTRTIIIDNIQDNFKMQPQNGMVIKTWNSDVNDNQLQDMQRILKDIYNSNASDVREIIAKIHIEYLQRIKTNCENPYEKIDINIFQ